MWAPGVVSLEPRWNQKGVGREHSAFSEASPRALIICPTDPSCHVPDHLEFIHDSTQERSFHLSLTFSKKLPFVFQR